MPRTPGIHLQFEGFVYAAAADALSVADRGRLRPDVVGPVGVGGAERFKGQWLDLQPYIDKAGIDMSQYPESTVKLYNAGGEGQLGIPYAVYPSVLFYKAGCSRKAGLNEPPHEWNAQYTMPDGSHAAMGLRHVREIAKILTVDVNGADATERASIREDRPVGLRAAARRPAPDGRLLRRRRADGV
jgi:multiple sugar transport system substrate-binding protein